MSNTLKFACGLAKIHLSPGRSKIKAKPADHNKAYKGRRIPLSVTVSTTFRCNLNCRHCASEINNSKKDGINTERFLRLIDEIAQAGAVKVGFTGGEPLLREDMGQIIERSHKNGLITSLVSNSWFVPERIKELKGLGVLFLSLDGSNKEVNDYIRGPGHWDKFHEAVALAKENKISVTALTNLNAMNYAAFSKFPDIFEKLNINWMMGMFEDSYGVGDQANFEPQERKKGSDYRVLPEDIRKMVDCVSKSKNLKASKNYLDFMRGRRPKFLRCYAGIGYCVVDPYCNLHPCFPAGFDTNHKGISLLDKSFGEAFEEMRLYRSTCDTCIPNCHLETNYLYDLSPNAVINAYKITKSA